MTITPTSALSRGWHRRTTIACACPTAPFRGAPVVAVRALASPVRIPAYLRNAQFLTNRGPSDQRAEHVSELREHSTPATVQNLAGPPELEGSLPTHAQSLQVHRFAGVVGGENAGVLGERVGSERNERHWKRTLDRAKSNWIHFVGVAVSDQQRAKRIVRFVGPVSGSRVQYYDPP